MLYRVIAGNDHIILTPRKEEAIQKQEESHGTIFEIPSDDITTEAIKTLRERHRFLKKLAKLTMKHKPTWEEYLIKHQTFMNRRAHLEAYNKQRKNGRCRTWRVTPDKIHKLLHPDDAA